VERSDQTVMVVHPVLKGSTDDAATARSAQARLDEAVSLARAISLTVADQRVVTVRDVRPSHLFGTGQVSLLADAIAQAGCGLVILDSLISPVQQRNLERAWGAKVIDRTGLILEIFGERAHTKEGALQVELAHLTYQQSRLVRSWTHLERQRGGFGFLGGPGETQIETDRRLIRERIARLRKDLEAVRRTRGLQRGRRQKAPYPVVALVGYTNAGKSTLFNRLTGAAVLAKDLLFATLDPTMRGITLPGVGKVILSDTVGFISDLPTQLIAAFRATLEEVTQADLILHVRDGAHPDSAAQAADVMGILADLGLGQAHGAPIIEVLNKVDQVNPDARPALEAKVGRAADMVLISALTGEGLDHLQALIAERLRQASRWVRVAVPHDQGDALAWLYAHGDVSTDRATAKAQHLDVRLTPDDQARFAARWPKLSVRSPSARPAMARH
jgi:GTP-binding protein HflX